MAVKLMKRMPSHPAATSGSFCCAVRRSSKLTTVACRLPSLIALCVAARVSLPSLSQTSSATAFVGNPVGHSFTLGRYMPLFIGQSGMSHIYSSGTIDQWPKNVSCILMYGNMWKIPAPDIQRTDYLICMGGNPQASGGSLLACPDVLGELDGIRERGGKVVVIDPRRTGTADHADEWVPILPGTDAAFLLAMCNVLFAEGLTTLGAL